MAFFKCGGSKTATIIDGVESGKDLNLKSLGLRDLGIITPRIPKSVLGSLTYSYYSTYDSRINIVPFQGKLYFIYNYSGLKIFQYEVDTNTWISIGTITSSFSITYIYWAEEINGIIYLYLGEKDVISTEYQQSIWHIEFTSDGINLIRDSLTPTYNSTGSSAGKACAFGEDIYFSDTSTSYLYKFSTTEKKWTRLTKLSYPSYIVSMVAFDDKLYIFTNYISTYILTYLYNITDNTLTRSDLFPPSNSSGINSSLKVLFFKKAFYTILRIKDSNSCYDAVLFKIEDGVWTQEINLITNSSLFIFNNEIWYRNAELSDGEGETLRLGKFSEVYELTK